MAFSAPVFLKRKPCKKVFRKVKALKTAHFRTETVFMVGIHRKKSYNNKPIVSGLLSPPLPKPRPHFLPLGPQEDLKPHWLLHSGQGLEFRGNEGKWLWLSSLALLILSPPKLVPGCGNKVPSLCSFTTKGDDLVLFQMEQNT